MNGYMMNLDETNQNCLDSTSFADMEIKYDLVKLTF